MQIWNWQKSGLVSLGIRELNLKNPTIIICGGSFNVDNPARTLTDETELVTSFFDFIMQYITADRDTFKSLICGPLEGKLKLNYFSVQKLLGFISAVPAHPLASLSLSPPAPESIDIMEISYSDTHTCIESIYKTHASGNYYSQDARQLADILFLPVLKSNGSDVEAVCKQFSLITLFGISYGSNFIIEIENALMEMLVNLGYRPEEKHRILSSVYAIAVSNVAHVVGARGVRFTAVYFEGINDHLAAWINPYKTSVQAGTVFRILSLAKHRLLFLLPVTVTAERWVEVIPEFDYFWLDNDKAAHYTPFYTMRCLPESFLPECVERVLRNAVSRDKTFANGVHDLLKSAPAFSAIEHPWPSQKAKVDGLITLAGYN